MSPINYNITSLSIRHGELESFLAVIFGPGIFKTHFAEELYSGLAGSIAARK